MTCVQSHYSKEECWRVDECLKVSYRFFSGLDPRIFDVFPSGVNRGHHTNTFYRFWGPTPFSLTGTPTVGPKP